MDSREKILNAIKNNLPPQQELPAVELINAIKFEDIVAAFIKTTEAIGSKVIPVKSNNDIIQYVNENYQNKVISTINDLPFEKLDASAAPHELNDTAFAIIQAMMGVAENGAVWITDQIVQVRALPFICENLAAVLHKKDILHNMHQAYAAIGNSEYAFGLFIAGPSKTADIEQSLVLGAHGPKTMTIFLMD